MKLAYPFPLSVLYPAVFLSGATALVYEIVWTRQLALVLGSTTGAAAAVLSAFMLGLAAGAVAVGRRADRSRRPLHWYALLEIGIGVYALAFSKLLALAGGSWLGSLVVVALPAAMMGATLPVLARAAADTTERGTRAFGGLYGVNTLGAVVGALLATLVLMEGYGLSGSTRLAAFVNLGLGVSFWILSVRAGEREAFAGSAHRRWMGDAKPAVVAAFFLAGFAGLALEMAWVRLLVYFLEGFTIAFGLMLASYLFGLGAGAIAGTFLALRSANPRRLLGRVLLAEGILALATFLFAGSIGDRLEAMRAGYAAADAMDAGYALALLFASAVVIVPATFCAGMLMPVVARIALSDRESIGSQTGAVYAASTLGAVAAPPVAGFWLIPALGVPGTIAATAALLLLAGSWLAMARGLKEWAVAGAAAAVFVIVFLACDLKTPLVMRSHVFRSSGPPRRLRVFREGLMAGVSVVEQYDDGTRLLYIDGFSAAETGRHYGYMRMLGHLPVLLHPNPEKVLVIAFGTGTTAGAAAVHDEVQKVVCVEIEPKVYEVASEFSGVNRKILDSPKCERVVADGREYVRRGLSFDVITLEPLMPYTPAAVYLYTREFYQDAHKSLRRNGLLCQWIPPHGVSNADFRRLVRSATDVFSHVSLWYFPHAVLVLMGDGAPVIDNLAFIKRCAKREVLKDLELARVGGPDQLLGAHVCSGDALEGALKGAEPFVDDRTDLEFRPLPRRFGKRSQTYHAANLAFLARHHDQGADWLADQNAAVTSARVLTRASMGAALDTLAVELRRHVEGGVRVPSSVLRHVVERDPRALFARSIYERRLYAELAGMGAFAEAAELRYAPDRSAVFLALARESDGEPSKQRARFYRLLALRENALLPPGILRGLAQDLEGPERRFCLNRARVQEGKPVEQGPEALPRPRLPSLLDALAAGDAERARTALAMARSAGLEKEAEKQAWTWWEEKAQDKPAATLLLHEIGSSKALLAARKLRAPTDRAAVAVVFAADYPRTKTWERLCGSTSPLVRAAAADAAATLAHTADARVFLPSLALLLDDPGEDVRLSAFIAFRGIHPDAESAGYDHRKPTREAIATLTALATR